MNAITIKNLRVDVRSSLIDYIEYDCYHQKLKVKFKKGKTRRKTHAYEGVSQNQFMSILNADSVGRAILRLGA